MPDFEYRQTVVTMQVPVPQGKDAEFRASGRIPLVQGWKAVYGGVDPDVGEEADDTLPPLTDGEAATLREPRVEAKRTVAPPRYNEGTLIDAMQNAWRFVEAPAMRERLKEAKGIGTPATRAEIIKGLKRQMLLAADGKLVVPTPAGLQLFELLRGAAPQLVDPGTTAVWEMRLDDVVVGKANFRGVIDEISAEADRLIRVLRAHNGTTVDLSQPPPSVNKGKRARKPSDDGESRALRREAKPRRKKADSTSNGSSSQGRRETSDKAPPSYRDSREAPARSSAPPTPKMVAFAQRLAKDKDAKLPSGYDRDFEICRKFLDQHAGR
jgi:DNA topoisomerase-3